MIAFLGAAVCSSPARTEGEWHAHLIDHGFVTQTVVAADFTGDGRPDVMVNGGRGESILYVAPNWAKVVVAPPPGVPTRPRHATHSAVMDADADGIPDYVVAFFDPGLIFWLRRPAEHVCGPWTSYLIDDELRGVHGVAVADIDGDGRPDLGANSSLPHGPVASSLVWYTVPAGPEAAGRWPRHVLAAGDAPGLTHYISLGDLDGDGRIDAVIAARDAPDGNWLAWWKAPHDPRRPWQKHHIAMNQIGASNALLADLNGDALVDVVASRGHGQGLAWFEAPNWVPRSIDDTMTAPHSLATGDIDGDGRPDVVSCATADAVCAWFRNDGHGRFSRHNIRTRQSAYEIRLVDMDGDGDLDVLIAGDQSRNVVWLENPLSAPPIPARAGYSEGLCPALRPYFDRLGTTHATGHDSPFRTAAVCLRSSS